MSAQIRIPLHLGSYAYIRTYIHTYIHTCINETHSLVPLQDLILTLTFKKLAIYHAAKVGITV